MKMKEAMIANTNNPGHCGSRTFYTLSSENKYKIPSTVDRPRSRALQTQIQLLLNKATTRNAQY